MPAELFVMGALIGAALAARGRMDAWGWAPLGSLLAWAKSSRTRSWAWWMGWAMPCLLSPAYGWVFMIAPQGNRLPYVLSIGAAAYVSGAGGLVLGGLIDTWLLARRRKTRGSESRVLSTRR